MAPFALMPAQLAWPVWNAAVGLLFVGQLYATIRLMRRPLWDAVSLAVILFTIALEPLHIGLANGQPTVPVISLIVLSLYWASSGRFVSAGVAFAVACALKPQLAGPFVLLLAFQGKWRAISVAAMAGVALTLAAVVPMTVRHPDWAHAWASQVQAAEGAGNIDSAATDNPGRNDLLNLALIGHLFTDSVPVVTTVCVTLWAAGVGVLFYLNRHRRGALGVAAAFAVLLLLPMYHRFYDAGLIVLTAAWGLTRLRTDARWPAVAVLAVSAVFVVPSDWLVGRFRAVTHPTPTGYAGVDDYANRTVRDGWAAVEPNLAYGTQVTIAVLAGHPVAGMLAPIPTTDELPQWAVDRVKPLFRFHPPGYADFPAYVALCEAVTRRWWFDVLAQAHHAWELLAVSAGLFVGVRQLRRWTEPQQVLGPLGNGLWERHRLRLGVALLIPFAVLEGWWISYDRSYYKELDFGMYYTGSRMFIEGGNPYIRANAYKTWLAADGEDTIMDYVKGPFWDEDHPEDYWLPINCIPPALVVIAPFAWFDVPVAYPLWNVAVGLLLAGQMVAVARLMGVRLWSVPALVVLVLTIMLDPLHTGLCNGQPAVPAVSLTILAAWLAVKNWQVAAGVALAVATSLKPQLGGPFVLLFLWQRRFKGVVVAAVTGAALTLAAVVPLAAHHIPWLTGPASWTEEVQIAEVRGGINDARTTDIGRNEMVHLQVLTHFFTDNATVANGLTLAIVGGLGYVLWRVAKDRPFDLATISAFSILDLLAAYHRLYDAGIIVLPIAWGVVNCRAGFARWPARVVLFLGSIYFVQQEWVDEQFFGAAGHPVLSNAWWFNLFVQPHHQWGMMGMFACLVIGLKWQQRDAPPKALREVHSAFTGLTLAGA